MAASVAQFDEDWEDFNEFKAADSSGPWTTKPEDTPEISSFQSIDETLIASFPGSNNSSADAVSERELLRDDQIWTAVTQNYGNVMPVDWKTSHTRSLHLPTLNLRPQERTEVTNLDLSDDEELRDQMDMHTIIISCVIEEIEELMQQSPDEEEHQGSSPLDLSMISQELQTLKHSSSYEERLRGLCVSELLERLEDIERQIRSFSEELIDRLALREELEDEKEVKNTFIAALIEVQNRQKEHRELLRKKRKIKSSPSMQGSERSHVPGTYLTTVIPYDQSSGSPVVSNVDGPGLLVQQMLSSSLQKTIFLFSNTQVPPESMLDF
ncbi:hypothetical protein DNTS_005152 [Danionella cerebrum]|uniref:Uncharacterized protein n=1 Tax=Danionella cerebrum TaxID=2873325 RepID=A0A553QEW1_9TELE|nr:hypothetical protein DNTS_005152 [Danionella translucida]